MYKILFYETSKEVSEFLAKLELLKTKTDKESRTEFSKIIAYLNLLSEEGSFLGYPFVKKLNKQIWELRPLRNRLLFACIKDNTIIIVHYFYKTTRKTPVRELRKANKNLKKVIEND